jgi:hypothetical protein
MLVGPKIALAALAAGHLLNMGLGLPGRLTVGADGVATRWLWRRRFFGYGEIAGVRRLEAVSRERPGGIRLVLTTGEEVDLPIPTVTEAQQNQGSRIALVEERIREAMDGFGRGDVAADAALLRRGDRAAGEWLSTLRSMGAGADVTLRSAPVSRERLLRVAEDPTAPVAARVAAVVALGDEDGDSRARLQRIAEATAAPELRRTIEKAAHSQDDAELAEALAEVEAEGSPRVARR